MTDHEPAPPGWQGTALTGEPIVVNDNPAVAVGVNGEIDGFSRFG